MYENRKELVSVIIPVYMVEKYLPVCMESVWNQTYQNLEIILVDDGSPDNCGELCDQYAKKDSRIKVVHKENGGLSSARNEGMDVATGEFFYFLDSDDYIENSLIEKCVNKLEKSNSDMVCFNYERFSEDGKRWVTAHFCENTICILNQKERIRNIANYFMKYKYGFEVWNRMYRASVIKKNEIRFAPNKLVFSEDICFNLCFLMHCNKISVIEDYLYNYFERNDSIMGKNNFSIKVKQHSDLAKIVYEECVQNSEYDYIKKNYYIIFMLLLDIQLMGIKIEKRPSFQVDDAFYKDNLLKAKKGLISEIAIMGLKRGIKHNLLARYYLKQNAIVEKILKTFL